MSTRYFSNLAETWETSTCSECGRNFETTGIKWKDGYICSDCQ